MPISKRKTTWQEKLTLLRSSTTAEEFVRQYKRLWCGKLNGRDLYLLLLTELKRAISEGNYDRFKKLSDLIDYTNDCVKDLATLRDYYDDSNNPIGNTNLVILANKYNNVNILEYLFDSNSKVVNNLTVNIGRSIILPEDEDEAGHNAFYYAMRSTNIQLLNILINKWPNNYFAKLDEILGLSYAELQLKKIPISDEVQIFVENELINLRFFSSGQCQNFETDLNKTSERIKLIIENVNLLRRDYSNTEEVDEKFLYIAKFIAQNIQILKWQLRSTYNRLPWEEIEFCMVVFISSYVKRQEGNLFYRATLSKTKMLIHIENFANKLDGEKNITKGDKLYCLPRRTREKVVAEIINSDPKFETLYNDYRLVRDVYSLEKIGTNIKLAVSVDPKEMEGQFVITRVLQIIGEHLKNTLESPKLSRITSELLVQSLPNDTKKIIVGLRDAISHANYLSKRIELEENIDSNFFINIQNDVKKIGDVITDILYKNKVKTIRLLLTKIVDSRNSDEINGVLEELSTVELDEIITPNFKTLEHEKLENLFKKLSDSITDKTNYEKDLFEGIYGKINSTEKGLSENIRSDYITGFRSLQSLSIALMNYKADGNVIREIKAIANRTLKNITPKIEPDCLEEIARLAGKLFFSVGLRIQDDQYEIKSLICQIFCMCEFEIGGINWIEELGEKLKEDNLTEDKCRELLALKLSQLKTILGENSLNGPLIEKLHFYTSNIKLQAAVEMLVLDVMSILDSLHFLQTNPVFLDENSPLLTGKVLRNYLAHDNVLFGIISDPSIAVLLNAKKLTEENIMSSEKKIGKVVNEDPSKLRRKHSEGLVSIAKQKKMFAALEEGNLESLKDCLKTGADLKGRDINLWTTVHFAAKGPNLKVVKFIFSQKLNVNVKDVTGHTPLHIAAAHGRQDIADFLVKKAGLYVDDENIRDQTALHVAAQNNHLQTVKVLLKNKANTSILDNNYVPPLQYAVRYNHINVAKILLEEDFGEGSTSLHEAALWGHLKLVNFLLFKKKANVNARTEINCTPLHKAAFYGHLEVAKTLILAGANVNARVIDGWTPLHCSVEGGHQQMVNILLKHGANVNAGDEAHFKTSLHFAASEGHEGIVIALLENSANVNAATVKGVTPLHFAIQRNHLKTIAVLLKYDVDIHAKDINNVTSLHYAAVYGHNEVAALLIKNGAEINAEISNGSTVLYIASMEGHKDVADLLVKNKAEVNSQNISGRTPLHAAAHNGRKDIIDLLVKNKAEVNIRCMENTTPLHLAILNGDRATIDFLIKNKAEVNANCIRDRSPLHLAVLKGDKDIVNLLIANKAEVNVKGNADITPLRVAVEVGHKEIVEILIASGADVKSNNQTLLFSAIRYNRKEIVEILMANGATTHEANAEGLSPFSVAILAGYTDIVEILLKNESDVNMAYCEGYTLLQLSAKMGRKKLVKALIRKGAEIDAVSINNVTPLYYAAREGYDEVVAILAAGGANVNFKTNEDITPLHMAAINGHSNVVKVLLENKANVNVQDNKKNTPVELATAFGRLEVVKILLDCTDSNIIDGYTLLHIASRENNLEVVKYLVDKGSDIDARTVSGDKAIHIAAGKGYIDTVKFFLSKRLSINDPGAFDLTILHCAAMNGHLEIVNYLIEQSADITAEDTNGLTPLHHAALFGYIHIVETLLTNGAPYNSIDKSDRTPLQVTINPDLINILASTQKLFIAVTRNNPSEVLQCIEEGSAFINAKNAEGQTPLHYAAMKGYDRVVSVLLQRKANPNITDKIRMTNDMNTPLHIAASKGYKEVVPQQYILINTKTTNDGDTALHVAALNGHLDITKSLLKRGAIYNIVNNQGKTPLDLCPDHSITNLLKLIEELFEDARSGNVEIIGKLRSIKSDEFVAVTHARNTQGYTLLQITANKCKKIASKLLEMLKDPDRMKVT